MAGTTPEILKRIIQRSQDFVAHSSVNVTTSSCSLASQSLPQQSHVANISLPDPPPMQPALVAAGACPEIASAMDQAYQKRAADLQALCRSAVTLVCSNQAQYPSKYRYVSEQKVLSVFTELYLKQLVTWRDEGVVLYLKHSSTDDKTNALSRAAKFNHVRKMPYLCQYSPV